MPLITGGETFVEGEVLVGDATGYIGEAATNPATVTGISLASSLGMSATGEVGHLSDQARPVGTLIQFYKPASGQLFTCSNLTENSSTRATPTIANVFDTAGFYFDNTNWWVDTNASNVHVEIVAVLDSRGAPLGDTTIRTVGTGVAVVFGFL
jgi:hypothetical protein